MARHQIAKEVALRTHMGKRIREIRENELKRDQQWLACAAGISKGYLSQIETGKRMASMFVIATIVESLDMTLGDFFLKWL